MVILDCQAIGYSSYYALKELRTSEGVPVGTIYGFFMQLKTIVEQTQCAHIVFCWDNKNCKRKKIYPEYKATRKETRSKDPMFKDVFYQFDKLIYEILPSFGIVNNFAFEGYEADDIIARICKDRPDEQITIVTNDQDMYQLLTDNVKILKMSNWSYYTKKMFVKEYGIQPVDWIFYKAIAGCPGDNVTGIRFVGLKTVLHYLKGECQKPHPLIDTKEGKEIIARNWPLVELPLEGTPSVKLVWPKLNFEAWKQFVIEYEFKKFYKEHKFWKMFFEYKVPEGFYLTTKGKYLAKKANIHDRRQEKRAI